MVKALGKGISWTYDRLVAFSNHLAIMEAVGQDRLSFFDAMTMSTKEAAEWLDNHSEAAMRDKMAQEMLTESVYNQWKAQQLANEELENGVGTTDELASSTENLAEVVNESAKSKNDLLKEQAEILAIVGDTEKANAEMAAYRNKKTQEEAEARLARIYAEKVGVEDLGTEETALAIEVDKVTAAATASVDALHAQADAANEVAAAARNIASSTGGANTRKDGETDSEFANRIGVDIAQVQGGASYASSSAWSGGTKSMGGSSFENSLTDRERSRFVDMTPAGRGTHFYDTYGNTNSRGPMSGGGRSGEYLDTILLQQESAIREIQASRLAGNGGTSQEVMQARFGFNQGQNIFNFNQQVSRSDITNITRGQDRNEARA